MDSGHGECGEEFQCSFQLLKTARIFVQILPIRDEEIQGFSLSKNPDLSEEGARETSSDADAEDRTAFSRGIVTLLFLVVAHSTLSL